MLFIFLGSSFSPTCRLYKKYFIVSNCEQEFPLHLILLFCINIVCILKDFQICSLPSGMSLWPEGGSLWSSSPSLSAGQITMDASTVPDFAQTCCPRPLQEKLSQRDAQPHLEELNYMYLKNTSRIYILPIRKKHDKSFNHAVFKILILHS